MTELEQFQKAIQNHAKAILMVSNVDAVGELKRSELKEWVRKLYEIVGIGDKDDDSKYY